VFEQRILRCPRGHRLAYSPSITDSLPLYFSGPFCAIDALGIAGMFRTDALIESSWRACGSRIEIGAQGGKSLSHAQPVDAVIWYDLAYSGRAATSCCPSIAFFCSEAELQQRSSAQSPRRAGYLLTLDEALEVGRALIESVPRPAVSVNFDHAHWAHCSRYHARQRLKRPAGTDKNATDRASPPAMRAEI
jgi:Alkylmercury lyase